jgi:pimeloyl-ACP methyl ester carboxylesterase
MTTVAPVPPPPELHVAATTAEADGPAPLVVVVHGAMDRSSSFGRVLRSLRDLDVVRYDRRGYGRSVGLGPSPFEAHVADLLSVIDGRPCTVFGHSIGGVIGLAAAARRPDLVRSLLVYESPMPWADWWPGRAVPVADADPEVHAAAHREVDPAAEAEAFMLRAVGERIWNRLPERTRAERRAEGGALLADMASVSGDAPIDPAAVEVPVLVGCGAESSWWHRRAADELVAALPDAELAVVGGARHGVHLSHPSAVAALVHDAVALAAPT